MNNAGPPTGSVSVVTLTKLVSSSDFIECHELVYFPIIMMSYVMSNARHFATVRLCIFHDADFINEERNSAREKL